MLKFLLGCVLLVAIAAMSITGYRLQQYINACSPFEAHAHRVKETLGGYQDALEFYARMTQSPYPTGLPEGEASPHIVWGVFQKIGQDLLSIPPSRIELAPTHTEVKRQLATFDRELVGELDDYDRSKPACDRAKEQVPAWLFRFDIIRSLLDQLIK